VELFCDRGSEATSVGHANSSAPGYTFEVRRRLGSRHLGVAGVAFIATAGRRYIPCPGAESYVLEIDNFCRAMAGEAAPVVTADLSRRVAGTLELVAASARPISRGGMP
jgi:hypothetical protein